MTLKCDLTNEDDIKAVFQKIKEKWGGVDVCVNNAGVTLNSGVLDGDPSQWEYMWKVGYIKMVQLGTAHHPKA